MKSQSWWGDAEDEEEPFFNPCGPWASSPSAEVHGAVKSAQDQSLQKVGYFLLHDWSYLAQAYFKFSVQLHLPARAHSVAQAVMTADSTCVMVSKHATDQHLLTEMATI